MNEKLENYLLYCISDDWTPISDFDSITRSILGTEYSRPVVLEIIAELARAGMITLGAFPGNGQPWEPWNIPVDEAIQRIGHGYDSEQGYLDLTENDIGSSEVFRADLTPLGTVRLEKLGNPYQKYGPLPKPQLPRP